MIEELIKQLKEKKLKISTAESCTGGMLSALITSVSGSSEVFSYGFVTYSNDAKVKLLDVSEDALRVSGAVSEAAALEMCRGARRVSGSDIAVAITGIAGPKSDNTAKPVGLVYIGVSSEAGDVCEKFLFDGSRDEIRNQSVNAAITLCIETTLT